MKSKRVGAKNYNYIGHSQKSLYCSFWKLVYKYTKKLENWRALWRLHNYFKTTVWNLFLHKWDIDHLSARQFLNTGMIDISEYSLACCSMPVIQEGYLSPGDNTN